MTNPTLQDTIPDAATRTLALAETVMGDRNRALSWLKSPKRSLGNEAPMDLLDTEPGARAVAELLYSIDDGYFA